LVRFSNLFFPTDATPEERLRLIVEALERSSAHYPQSETREFTILYGTRTSEGMPGKFNLYQVDYAGGKNVSQKEIPIPQKSGILARLGSGGDQFRKHLDRWEKSDVGGTSRAVFSSFADFLKSGDDPKTGGPPQLTGLFRKHRRTLGAPTGFALEGLRDAERIYEKTTRGRARDARQELHNAERTRAPQK
jgi:hypothetical protein